MTDYLVRLSQHSPGALASGWVPADEVAVTGSISCRPYAPDINAARIHAEGPDRIILPEPFSVRLVNGEATLPLRPTDAWWCWEIREQTKGGRIRYLTVVDSALVLDYADLVDVDPVTLAATATPPAAWTLALADLDGRMDALEAAPASSGLVVSDAPTVPAEGEAVTYWVTSAVSWPAGLVWSDEPDAGIAPTITSRALVSLVTVAGVTYAVAGSTFTAAAAPDTTAPTVPAGLTVTATSATTVDLSWSASTDAVGVTGYEYSVGGGAAVNAGAGTTETVTGLTASTLYSFEVRAYDAAGNRSAYSTAATATTQAASADTTPPTVGTMAASSITTAGFTLTVSGASDETALHATPYAFTTDNGTSWSAYQASAVFVASGLTASTSYQCNWRVRDAALNVSTGTVQTITTGAPLPVVAGLVGHWDPSDSATVTLDAGAVSQLADKSGNGYHLTQAAGGYRPATTTLNGIGALAFTGDTLSNTTGMTLGTSGDTYTLAIVTTPSAVPSKYVCEIGKYTIPGVTDGMIVGFGGVAFERYADDGAGVTRYTIAASATGHHVITNTRNVGAWSSTYDGTASGSGTDVKNSINPAGIHIGSSQAPGDAFTGTIGEIVLYSPALSAGDLDLVEAYLKTKWGVA